MKRERLDRRTAQQLRAFADACATAGLTFEDAAIIVANEMRRLGFQVNTRNLELAFAEFIPTRDSKK